MSSGGCGKNIRLKPHRTDTHTFGTSDAGTCRTVTHGFFSRQDCYAVCALAHRDTCRHKCLAHHGAACYNLVVSVRKSATCVNELTYRSPHPYKEILRLADVLTRDTCVSFEQRFVLHYRLIYGEGSPDIHDNRSDIGWYCGREPDVLSQRQ